MCTRQGKKSFNYRDDAASFHHDPDWIRFRQWTSMLYLEGQIPEGANGSSSVLSVGENWQESHIPQFRVRTPLSLKNTSRIALQNLSVVENKTGKEVFFSRSLPPKRFLDLEFLKEGLYTLYWVPAFTECVQQRSLGVVAKRTAKTSVPENFQPELNPLAHA